ncbi:MAG: GNAT family N-acetyltransferase [Candidatus Aminicenantes bacterium]|nr:MAG: GNAT family N-acetyltransferase [Candidatus Aminicenantes bacterium]
MKIFPKLPEKVQEELGHFELENFYREEERTPEYLATEKDKYFSTPKAWLLVFEENQIIGSLKLHKRNVKFNNKNVMLGGLGGVCVRRDKRRQGIAGVMIEKAMKILKEWECEVAYLCAHIEESGSLYPQAGFVSMKNPYTYFGQSGKLYEETNGFIAPVKSLDLFKKILNSEQKLHLGKGNW